MKKLYFAILTLLTFQSMDGLSQCTTNSSAPISNRSFEQWINQNNYIDPFDWTTNNDSVYAPVVRDSIDKVDGNYSMRVEHSGIARSKKFLLHYNWFFSEVKYDIISGDTIVVRLIRYQSGNAIDSIQETLTTTYNNWRAVVLTRFENFNDTVEVLVIGGKQVGTTINMDCMAQYFLEVQNLINGQKVTLYPNPTNHIATLHFKNEQHAAYDLFLMAADGRIVYRQNNTGNVFNIDCSRLASGIYFWKLSNFSSNDHAAGKIIIQ